MNYYDNYYDGYYDGYDIFDENGYCILDLRGREEEPDVFSQWGYFTLDDNELEYLSEEYWMEAWLDLSLDLKCKIAKCFFRDHDGIKIFPVDYYGENNGR